MQPIYCIMRFNQGEWVCTFKGPPSNTQELSPGSDLLQAYLQLAACRADLVSARVFNKGRHQGDVHTAYLAHYAIHRRRVGMHP